MDDKKRTLLIVARLMIFVVLFFNIQAAVLFFFAAGSVHGRIRAGGSGWKACCARIRTAVPDVEYPLHFCPGKSTSPPNFTDRGGHHAGACADGGNRHPLVGWSICGSGADEHITLHPF